MKKTFGIIGAGKYMWADTKVDLIAHIFLWTNINQIELQNNNLVSDGGAGIGTPEVNF